jgi:hypothetical protein
MDAPEFRRQIGRGWNLFSVELRLGRTFICGVSLPIDEEFRRVALAPESSYAEIYRTGLSRSAYNFLIDDYSYFQFSWDNERAWRMAYYPNPWITGVADAQEILAGWEALETTGELTHEEASDLIDELPYRGAVPPIRFEYSYSQYREIAHPAAHLHMGRNSDNRWPCALLLGPAAFCMMIARLYYPDQWRPRSSFEDPHAANCLDLQFADVVQASQAVGQFTDRERRMLHLGRNLVPIRQPRDHETARRRSRQKQHR